MQGKLLVTALVVVVLVMAFCTPETEAQLTVAVDVPSLIVSGVAALIGSFKKGSVEVLGTTCKYRTRPTIYKWWAGSRAKVSCSELGINKKCRKRRSKQAISCAVEQVVKQAVKDGKVTAQEAADFFKQ